jgi:hypothetical protein
LIFVKIIFESVIVLIFTLIKSMFIMNINKPNHLVMEAKNLIRFFFLLSFGAVLIFTSCVKEGPMGLPGVDGVNGVNGKDGTDGKDGTASCVACHNKTTKALAVSQFTASAHGTMPNKQTRGGCIACHSAEGFIESLTNVSTKTFTDLTTASPLNCESCHTTHKTFDFAADGPDYALRTTAPVPLFMDKTVVLDMGTSSLCVNCHQPRSVQPVANAEGNFVVANNRFGPHYGSQAVVLHGTWGYLHAQGSTAIPGAGTHPHRKNASCTSCHMHDGTASGGHSWKVGPESCKSCHPTINTKEAITASKSEFYTLFNQLGDKLLAVGALRTTADGGLEPNPGTYPIAVAGALFNYRMLYGDHSGGTHNPAYSKALLRNSIEALN